MHEWFLWIVHKWIFSPRRTNGTLLVMIPKGHEQPAQELEPDANADTAMRCKDGVPSASVLLARRKLRITDGPFAEAKEVIGIARNASSL